MESKLITWSWWYTWYAEMRGQFGSRRQRAARRQATCMMLDLRKAGREDVARQVGEVLVSSFR